MAKYRISQTKMFKKDLKLAIKRGYDMNLIGFVVDTLADGKPLPEKYRDHNLTGNYKGCRECLKYIWSAMPDGAGPGYSINSVYGLCMSCWEESLKDIHSPKNENDLWLQMYRN